MRVACIWFESAIQTSKTAELFLRFSPQICLRSDRAIFVEIGKCKSLYSESSFIKRALALIKKQNLTARIKVTNELTEALCLAKFNAQTVDELPLTALLEFCDPFDRDVDLRANVLKMIAAFQDLGVSSVGQFKKIPSSDLISRFGIVGRHCYHRLHYKDIIPWPMWSPEEVIVEEKDFPYFEFYGELEPILFELKSQLDSIFARLFARKKRLTKLQVKIKCEKTSSNQNNIRTFDFEFFAPQGATKGALRILKERLTRDFEKSPIASPIEALNTIVVKAVDFNGGQKNLLNNDEEKFESLYSVHNQLVELLGKENIFQAELTEDRRPEKSWSKKFGSPHEKSIEPKDFLELIPDRPTYLCRKPIRIEVTAGYVHIRKRRYRILNWDNQIEKINGGWFEQPTQELKNTFDRIYFNVEIEGHQKITVFETQAREFFLHGYYG